MYIFRHDYWCMFPDHTLSLFTYCGGGLEHSHRDGCGDYSTYIRLFLTWYSDDVLNVLAVSQQCQRAGTNTQAIKVRHEIECKRPPASHLVSRADVIRQRTERSEWRTFIHSCALCDWSCCRNLRADQAHSGNYRPRSLLISFSPRLR